jgi:hypothetical protein
MSKKRRNGLKRPRNVNMSWWNSSAEVAALQKLLTTKPVDPNSAAFKQWFGDSKVVDVDGDPLIVWRGSSDIRAFGKTGTLRQSPAASYVEGGQAFFFTDSYRVADTYADDSRAFDYRNALAGVAGFYLRIKNPYIIDARGAKWGQTQAQIKPAYEAGHDGVIIKNSRDDYSYTSANTPSTVYVIFDLKNAKLADGRDGPYDEVEDMRRNGRKRNPEDQSSRSAYEQSVDYVQTDAYIPVSMKGHVKKKKNLVIVSLFDRSGRMITPWVGKGHTIITIDLGPKTYPDWKGTKHIQMNALEADPSVILKKYDGHCDVLFCFPPCTEFSLAGNAWVERKFKEDPLYVRRAMDLVDTARWWATYSTYWMIENPAGKLPKLWRKPNWFFDPYEYAGYAKDEKEQVFNYYKKKTAIWANFCKPATKLINPKWKPKKQINVDNMVSIECPIDPRPFATETKAQGGREGQEDWAMRYLKSIDDEGLRAVEAMGGMSRQKKQRHYVRSLTPSGFAQAVYLTLTEDPLYQPTLEYRITPPDTGTGFAQRQVVANPRRRRNSNDLIDRGLQMEGYLNCKLFAQQLTGVCRFEDLPSQSFNMATLQVGDVLQWGVDPGRHYAVYVGGNNVIEVEEWGGSPQVTALEDVIEEWGHVDVQYSVKKNPKRRRNSKGRNLGYGTANAAMLRNQLRSIERISKELHDTLTDADQVPDWVLSKAIVAMDRLIVANEYIQSKLEGMNPNPTVDVDRTLAEVEHFLAGLR